MAGQPVATTLALAKVEGREAQTLPTGAMDDQGAEGADQGTIIDAVDHERPPRLLQTVVADPMDQPQGSRIFSGPLSVQLGQLAHLRVARYLQHPRRIEAQQRPPRRRVDAIGSDRQPGHSFHETVRLTTIQLLCRRWRSGRGELSSQEGNEPLLLFRREPAGLGENLLKRSHTSASIPQYPGDP